MEATIHQKATKRFHPQSKLGHAVIARVASFRVSILNPVILCRTSHLNSFASLNQEDRGDGQNGGNADHNGLNAKDQTGAIPGDPCWLEVSHCEATTSPPHVQDGRHAGGLSGILFQRVGCDGTA